MNRRLQEEIRFRKWVQSILVEESVYNQARQNPDVLFEYMSLLEGGVSGDPIGAFLDPFKDVLNVAKVATKDLLSVAKFNFDMITTLSPSKQKAAREKWEGRNKALESEWGKAMEPIDKVWDTSDAQLIGFMLNPAGFLGAKMASKSLDTADGAVAMLDDAGWGIPFVTDFVRGADAKSTSKGEDRGKSKSGSDGVVDILGTGKKMLGDLAKLFFIAHHAPTGNLIAEAKSGSASSGVQQYMDKMPGLESAITKDGKQMLDAKAEHVKEIMAMFDSQIKMLTGLSDAYDLTAFITVLDAAAQEGVDLGGAGLANFKSEVDANVQKILGDPKAREGFIKTYFEEKGKKPELDQDGKLPEVPDDVLVPEVEKVVFLDSKTSVQEQLFTGSEQLKKQAQDEIMIGTPEQSVWPMISQTTLGVEYISLIQTAIQKITNA
jgi:hypothetical protein